MSLSVSLVKTTTLGDFEEVISEKVRSIGEQLPGTVTNDTTAVSFSFFLEIQCLSCYGGWRPVECTKYLSSYLAKMGKRRSRNGGKDMHFIGTCC